MDNLIKKITEKGFKLTKPRLAILEIIKNNHNPLSAQEIYQKNKKQNDLASIYRNLELFLKLKIIQEEISAEEKKYYLSPTPHHHITCEKCGHTQCVPCNHIFKTIKNFTNIKHQLTLTGICNKCN